MLSPPDVTGPIGREHTIAYAGCTEAGLEVLRRLCEAGVDVDEIVTLDPAMAADSAVPGYHDYREFADRNDIDVYLPETYGMGTDADRDHFEALDADLLVVNGWQRLVPGAILRTSTRGALGVHGSAFGLPKGRGRSPMNWSIIEGLDRFLLSVIGLDEAADAGRVLDTAKYDIGPHDDIQTLYHKLTVATTRLLLSNLPAVLAGEATFAEQTGTPTYYPKRTPEDGAIHWEDPTATINRLVRAVTRPYPGAFTEFEGERVMVWDAVPFSDDFRYDDPPGTVVEVFETTGEFVVTTPDGTLLVRDWAAEDWTPERGQQFASLPNDSIGSPNRVDGAGRHDELS